MLSTLVAYTHSSNIHHEIYLLINNNNNNMFSQYLGINLMYFYFFSFENVITKML